MARSRTLNHRGPHDRGPAHRPLAAWVFSRHMVGWTGCCMLAVTAGCRSDLNQQLLERELRLQEDQIYCLQDELQQASSKLDRAAVENASLKKQLGIVDPDASLPTRALPPPSVAAPAKTIQAAPSLAPPTIEVPPIDSSGIEFVPPPRTPPVSASPAPPVQPPPLSLPDTPAFDRAPPAAPPRSADPPSLPPAVQGASFSPPPDLPPPVAQLSHEESLSVEQEITHIVVSRSRTAMFDENGDGQADGITVVFEPRNREERLVAAVGDVTVTAFDAAAPLDSPPVAAWQIPSQEALRQFRKTSRARGLHLVLRWPAAPPPTDRLRLAVRMTTFEGKSFDQEATAGR